MKLFIAATLSAVALSIALPSAAFARDPNEEAIRRARQQQELINRKNEAEAARLREQQRRINEENARRYSTSRSSGSAAGYNVSRSSETAIGTDSRTGGVAPGDADRGRAIKEGMAKVRERKQRP